MTHTDDLLERHEAELRDLIERTMSDATAPTEIGPHALRHGRRMRARRRAGLAMGAIAASATVVLVLPMAIGGDSTTVLDPAGEPSSSATAPATDSLVRERPEGWWNMPSADMVSTAEAILPDGVTVTSPGPLTADTEEGGPGIGYIVPEVTGPGGAGQLNVILSPASPTYSVTVSPDPGSSDGGDHVLANDCDAPELADSNLPCSEVDEQGDQVVTPGGADGDISCPGNLATRAQCTEIFAADGTTLVGWRSSTTFGEVTTLEVRLRRDGGSVYAAAINSLDRKPGRGATASAPTPPLTLDQLEDLVRNDTWVRPAT